MYKYKQKNIPMLHYKLNVKSLNSNKFYNLAFLK